MPDTQQARMRVRQQHRNRVRFVLEIPARITDAGVRIHVVCPNGRAQVRKRLRIRLPVPSGGPRALSCNFGKGQDG